MDENELFELAFYVENGCKVVTHESGDKGFNESTNVRDVQIQQAYLEGKQRGVNIFNFCFRVPLTF